MLASPGQRWKGRVGAEDVAQRSVLAKVDCKRWYLGLPDAESLGRVRAELTSLRRTAEVRLVEQDVVVKEIPQGHSGSPKAQHQVQALRGLGEVCHPLPMSQAVGDVLIKMPLGGPQRRNLTVGTAEVGKPGKADIVMR